MVQKPHNDAERKERRIDLSLPQVAGSALAAVAAAVMASQLGVYGTIAGAGVMSIVATCGGSVFQHFFSRTGEQIREVTVQVKHPAGRQVTVRTRETSRAPRRPEDDATRVLRTVEPDPDLDRTTVLPPAGPGDLERTTMLRQVRPGGPAPGDGYPGAPAPGDAPVDDSFSGARTHGTRVRGWKRSALAAAGVFVLAMGGITVYEVVSGHGLGGNGGTTVGSVVRGERDGGATTPQPSGSTGGSGQEENGDDGRSPGGDDATTPGTDPGDGVSERPGTTDGTTSGPTPAPSASGGSTAPEPTSPTAPGDDVTPTEPEPEPEPTATDDAPAVREDGAAGPDAGR
ncbi:hypothetical protein [Streptomyces atroolivaceus]|uniref:hypothetical protein n=1 Tax=Streptomyces atroolivaceus TaxID=66869 RepID=UPI0034395E3A